MIVFDLQCRSGNHVFEAWFSSSGDYEDQQVRGLVLCPLCGADGVEKALMAPRLGTRSNRKSDSGGEMAAASPAAVKKAMSDLAAEQKKILATSSYVGERFADEARAIHLGEADARAIHGKATRAETDSLLEDGIPVAPLPFPVIEPGEEN